MEQKFGIDMPPKMREDFGYAVKSVSDHAHKELNPDEVYDIFFARYVNKTDHFRIDEAHFAQKNGIIATVTADFRGKLITREANGNGRLNAVSNAIKDAFSINYTILSYTEHALEHGSSSEAAAYVGIQTEGGVYWGAGIDTDIIVASVNALVSAINNSGLLK